MSVQTTILVIFTLNIAFESSTSFLLEDTCVVSKPCTCYSGVIDCGGRHLTQVPSFIPHTKDLYSLEIVLYSNQLTTVPGYAFTNLSYLHVADISMFLNDNDLNDVDQHAFVGISGAIKYLNLMNNNLTKLPDGLSSLTAIQKLYMDGNPLLSLDASILAKLTTLLTFAVSANEFASFPTDLHVLNNLTELRINKIPFSSIPPDAFNGLESNLHSLTMSFSNLEKIPSAVCNLTSLQSLHFEYSRNILFRNFTFDNCFNRLTLLTILSMNSNNMTSFPNISGLFPKLSAFHLRLNNIQFIRTEFIGSHAALLSLDLSANSLVRVPDALDQLLNLETLDLSGNKILSVEDFDLQYLGKLKNLQLTSNPLIYVSTNAFANNPVIESLSFAYTKLISIPEAVMGLKSLGHLDLSGLHLDCSCSAMKNLKFWNFTSVDIRGYCRQGISINRYLNYYFPRCV